LFGKPWNENYADLPLALGPDLILVVNNRLGCLNGAPLSLDYGVRRGWRVAGYILNDAAGDNSPATRSNGASLRVSPRFSVLARSVAVRRFRLRYIAGCFHLLGRDRTIP
jgi:dethiobiotin synthetase